MKSQILGLLIVFVLLFGFFLFSGKRDKAMVYEQGYQQGQIARDSVWLGCQKAIDKRGVYFRVPNVDSGYTVRAFTFTTTK